jgi:hypothetical protein
MNWSITQIKTIDQPVDGVIVVASFTVTDGTSTIESDTRLSPADADSFVVLPAVTEAMVVEWVKDALGDQVAVYEAMVAEKTSAIEPVVTSLPWEQ